MSALPRLIAFLLFIQPSPCPEVDHYVVRVAFMCQSGTYCGFTATPVPWNQDPLCLNTMAEPSVDTVYWWNEAPAYDVNDVLLPLACQTGVPTLEP